MTEAKADEAIACTVTGALSGEVVATVPVSLGEAVSDIAKRVMKLLPPLQRAFDDVESYALTFDGVPLEDEKCVLMIDDVAASGRGFAGARRRRRRLPASATEDES